MKKQEIDYNDLIKFKSKIEELFYDISSLHEDYIEIINDGDCFDDDKIDDFYSYLKDYKSSFYLLKSDFNKLKSHNEKIKSCMSQTKIMKKKRMSKLNSNMRDTSKDILDDDLPF